jgi:hypothetical protein
VESLKKRRNESDVTLQSRGVSNGGNEKPPNTWKTITEHPKKVFESRSIAFMVQILFVDRKVALL